MSSTNLKMKFVVKRAEQLSTGGMLRSFNVFQVPIVGTEYDTDATGRVIGMDAIVLFESGQWYWIPIPSSYASYSFKPERFIIDF